MTRIRFARLLSMIAIAISIAALSSGTARSLAQDAAEAQRAAVTTERFVDLLLSRPRPGTALDHVYGFHVQAGTLDGWMAELETQAEQGGDDAGARYMLLGLLRLQRGRDDGAAEAFARAEQLRGDDARQMIAQHAKGEAARPMAKVLLLAIDAGIPEGEKVDVTNISRRTRCSSGQPFKYRSAGRTDYQVV